MKKFKKMIVGTITTIALALSMTGVQVNAGGATATGSASYGSYKYVLTVGETSACNTYGQAKHSGTMTRYTTLKVYLGHSTTGAEISNTSKSTASSLSKGVTLSVTRNHKGHASARHWYFCSVYGSSSNAGSIPVVETQKFNLACN